MIIFKNLSKIYPPDVAALKNINLHIRPKEFVSIVGRSGTGKTTLVRILIAEESPTKGEIIVGGWDITNIRQSEIPVLRRQIGVVFQDFKLLSKKTVFENIAFALEVCGTDREKIKEIIPQVLKIVGLENKQDRYPRQLSGGEQQRVAIARALVHRPKILVADEPTGNLDAFNTREIVDLLLKINEFGTTVLLVSHNSEVVNSINKRVITLDNGQVSSDQKVGKYLL
ncbi:MAG: cell division ATP-binding protein FtsE [Candidatus Buchananbacteria bacterium RIFCSPHIGHO2_02_FULL_45_11b]|uniref:Cell division ATP-binding protein FtsE n=4 Tax=Candidatus Buchananiibacteriota TaxID=1817903 RepID=A0A1G1YNG7_9BACT|nr:MAG: cell division ATP-binding protein FtsE [Candidatus Buchananbacteria bacterium RIFCSPHIGHO2_01_FULL_46_12]OGY52323.1 MAG: cell division ATP-binding protein FtsE [Candidatus Buchananbacteria bacterium RIFCSPHIGHO2_02_FULL_45_11b]OGY53190.1 MAG: cell division ATP-binding protein FtsE [Candidatus Buchananbacteria bacterium RIFCSPLOWO2_01_FULL_45_31]OGY56716.1 MAG: cell division ATP-binding protein FtsE [Candidatus Buchananbacteria bacterium RIFCSPLOWO2_02_FULL_46_11b]